SHIHSSQGLYKEAVDDGLLVIEAGEADVGCYDTTAFWALFDGQLERSLKLYLIALKMGEEQDDSWFRSNELFLIGYIYFKLGDFKKAASFLDKLEDDDKESSFLVPIPEEGILGQCEVMQLYEEIRIAALGK